MTLLVPLLDKLPPSIRIGPFDIKLRPWPLKECAGQNKFASFSSWDMAIQVCTEIGFENVFDSLIHEIGHAFFYVYGLRAGDDEERIVSIQATAWTAFYRDNPRFAHWLADAATMMADAKG